MWEVGRWGNGEVDIGQAQLDHNSFTWKNASTASNSGLGLRKGLRIGLGLVIDLCR